MVSQVVYCLFGKVSAVGLVNCRDQFVFGSLTSFRTSEKYPIVYRLFGLGRFGGVGGCSLDQFVCRIVVDSVGTGEVEASFCVILTSFRTSA